MKFILICSNFSIWLLLFIGGWSLEGARHRLKPINETSSGQQLECGIGFQNVHSPRIIGGFEAQINEFPWQVGISSTVINSLGIDKQVCGGVVIDEWHILTAAHCLFSRDERRLSPRRMSLILGSVYFIEDSNFIYSVDKFIHHKDYKTTSPGDDIALIKTATKLDFHRKVFGRINRVCMPDEDEHFSGKLIVSGWGRTSSNDSKPSEILKYAHVTAKNSTECKPPKFFLDYHLDYDKLICTDDKEIAPCHGDSGGPLIWKNDKGKSFLVGVASFVTNGTSCIGAAYYTRVSKYLKWIEDAKVKLKS